jgi:hypothetical protein
MGSNDRTRPWLPLGLVGLASLCCVGLGTFVGGAALGGTAGTSAVAGGASGLVGLLVSVVVALLTVVVIGLVATRRRSS